MRAAIERWLSEIWYGGKPANLGLRALAGIYRAGTHILRSTDPEPVPVPVLVVGNFVQGGVGKTPVVIALTRHFTASGHAPGIVSRGYGRRSTDPVQVGADTALSDSGDEPRLLHDKTGRPVFVDADRAAAARAAVAAGCDMVIADDGLQHHALARDVEIEVVDGLRRYGNGLLFPAGPLREKPRHCDFRVVNGGRARPGEWQLELVPGDAARLDAPAVVRPLSSFKHVTAVAGIGNPTRFFEALRRAGMVVVERPFGDHHAFTRADFADLDLPVLMTEKDAVKCRGLALDDAWVVPVEASLPPEFFDAVRRKLNRLATHA